MSKHSLSHTRATEGWRIVTAISQRLTCRQSPPECDPVLGLKNKELLPHPTSFQEIQLKGLMINTVAAYQNNPYYVKNLRSLDSYATSRGFP